MNITSGLTKGIVDMNTLKRMAKKQVSLRSKIFIWRNVQLDCNNPNADQDVWRTLDEG